MCCEFLAESAASGKRIRVEASDFGCVDEATRVFQTVYVVGTIVISSYSRSFDFSLRHLNDERALKAFGFRPDWDTVRTIDCAVAHHKAEAA